MEIFTQTNSRETTLTSFAAFGPFAADLRPETTHSTACEVFGMAGAWREQQLMGVDRLAATVKGGAIAGLGTADVTDHGVPTKSVRHDQDVADNGVTDHTYSFRLGSASCSPPV
jgi:hypothetical protein